MRYRRAKPMTSFALAAVTVLLLAAWITGLIEIVPGTPNGVPVAPVFVMALIAIALLFEW